MSNNRPQGEAPNRCAYCGTRIRDGLAVCSDHADLPRLDPERLPVVRSQP